MNSIRSSKLGGLVLCAVLALAVSGTAVASGGLLAFDDEVQGLQSEYSVGSDAGVTYTIEDPFTNVSNQYTLSGETELTNVSWTVRVFRAGTQISENTYGGQSFSQPLDVNNDGDEVRVALDGTTPAIENYTYPAEEQFLVANLTRVAGNNPTTFRTDRAHHYTADSADARQALTTAQAAIDDVGGHAEAENTLSNAASAYRNENFNLSADLAGDAQSQAESAESAAQRNRLIIYAVGALLVVGLIVGAVLYWRSQQDEYSKL